MFRIVVNHMLFVAILLMVGVTQPWLAESRESCVCECCPVSSCDCQADRIVPLTLALPVTGPGSVVLDAASEEWGDDAFHYHQDILRRIFHPPPGV